MNNMLNGTGWGEREKEEEIKVAPWLTPEGRELDRKIFVAEEAWEAAGRARERRKNREEQRRRVNRWQGAIAVMVLFAACALVEFVIR